MTAESLTLKVAKGTGYLTIASVLGYIISIIYRIFLVRWLGPADYGVLSLFLTAVMFIMSVFTLGIPNAVVKFVSESEDKEKRAKIISTAIYSMFFLSIVVCVSFSVLSSSIKSLFNLSESRIFVIAAISVLPGYPLKVLGGFFSGMQQFKYIALKNIIEKIVTLIFAATLLLLGFGVVGAATGTVLAFVFSLLFFGILYFRKFHYKFTRFSKPLLKKMIFFGIPVMLSSVAFLFMGWTDTFVIGTTLTTQDLGLFNSVLPIQYTIGIAIAALSTALFPAFSEANQKNKEILKRLLNRSVKYAAYLMIPLAVGSFFLAPYIVKILFGQSFMAATTTFKILSFAAIFISFTNIGQSFLSGEGSVKALFNAAVFTAVLNIALDYLFIFKYGIEGVAASTVLSMMILTIIFYTHIRKKTSIDGMPILKSIISAIIMSFAILFLLTISMNVYLKIATIFCISVIIYFGVLYLLKGFDETDKKFVLKFLILKRN